MFIAVNSDGLRFRVTLAHVWRLLCDGRIVIVGDLITDGDWVFTREEVVS